MNLATMAADAPSFEPSGRTIDWPTDLGRVHALGLTYAEHIRETGEVAGPPVVFAKRCHPLPADVEHVAMPTPQALAQSLKDLDPEFAEWLAPRWPTLPPLLDYEVEIGVLLRDAVTAEQLEHPDTLVGLALFVANDLTARSVQIAGSGAPEPLCFWSAAKSFAGFLPVGARLWQPDTPDLARWPELRLETRVNGVLRQSASSRELIHSPRELLRFAALRAPDQRLEAGDLVLTGTPAGVAFSVPPWKRRLAQWLPRRLSVAAAWRGQAARPAYLQAGDRVEVSAGWLGQRSVTISKADS